MATATYSFKGTADMSQHNEQIKKAKKEVNEYKKEVESAQKETNKLSKPNFSKAYGEQKKMTDMVKGTEKALDGLTKGFGGMIGKAGIWGAAFTAIFKGAQAHMKKLSEVSDQAADKMEAASRSMKASWDEFIRSTSQNGGWDNLFERMDLAATKARQLASLIDNAMTEKAINDVDILRIQNDIQRQRNIIDQAKVELKKKPNQAEATRLQNVITTAEAAIEDLTKQMRNIYNSRVSRSNEIAITTLEGAGFAGSEYARITRSGMGRRYIGAMGGNGDLMNLSNNMSRSTDDALASDQQRHWTQLFDYLDKVTHYSGNGKSDRWYNFNGGELTGDKGVRYLPLINQELQALGLQTIGKKSDGITVDLPTQQMSELDEVRRWRQQVLDRLQAKGTWDEYTNALNEAGNAEQAALQVESSLLQLQRKDLAYTYGNGGGGGNTKPKGPDWQVGSIAEIDDMIKKLKERLANEKFDLNTQIDITQQIQDLEDKKAMLELQVAIGGNTDLTRAFGGLLDGVLQSGTVDDFCANMVDLIDKYFESAPEFQLPAVLLPNKEMEEAAKEAMENMGKIIEEEYTKICEEIRAENQEMADSFSAMGSMFESLGTMMGDEAGRWASVFGSILSTVGETIAKLVALASANGVASAFELPFPANLGALATVLAGVAAAVSTFESYSNKSFASGGIFEGSGPRIGDMHLARVNPGEMILNSREQANLFRMLNGGIGELQGGGGGNVTFRISGTDLVGILNNHEKINRRVR